MALESTYTYYIHIRISQLCNCIWARVTGRNFKSESLCRMPPQRSEDVFIRVYENVNVERDRRNTSKRHIDNLLSFDVHLLIHRQFSLFHRNVLRLCMAGCQTFDSAKNPTRQNEYHPNFFSPGARRRNSYVCLNPRRFISASSLVMWWCECRGGIFKKLWRFKSNWQCIFHCVIWYWSECFLLECFYCVSNQLQASSFSVFLFRHLATFVVFPCHTAYCNCAHYIFTSVRHKAIWHPIRRSSMTQPPLLLPMEKHQLFNIFSTRFEANRWGLCFVLSSQPSFLFDFKFKLSKFCIA